MRSFFLLFYPFPLMFLPNIANTASSFTISMDPREMKYRDTRTSPWWTRVSPGGAWVVLNFMDKALKHYTSIIKVVKVNTCLRQPDEAPWKAGQLLSKFLFK